MKKLLSLLLSVVTCLSIGASCTSLKHEHITGAWEFNATQHWRGITCTWNQCLFDLLFEDHVDNDGNGECDVCGYLPIVPEHTTHTGEYRASEYSHWYVYTCGCPSPAIAESHTDADDDKKCDICGYQQVLNINIQWQYSDTHHWWVPTAGDDSVPGVVYGYGEHTYTVNSDICDVCGYTFSGTTPTNYFLRNQTGAEWLQEVTADDIAEIKIISEEGMVAYGCFKDVASSNEQATIEKMLEKYYWLDMWPVDEKDTIIMDGGVVTVEFIMDNGAINRLTFNNGDFYEDSNGNHFELLYLPTFDDTLEHTTYKEFITRTGKGSICQLLGDTNLEVEPVLLGEIPMDEIKFIPVDISFGAGVFTPTYGIETDFGFLTFMDKEIFYINSQPNYYYQLVGKNLDELIDEYCAD